MQLYYIENQLQSNIPLRENDASGNTFAILL